MENKSAHVIMIKYPVAGNVKTRLGKSIGMEKAAKIYKFLVETIIKQCKSADFDTILFIDDCNKIENTKNWLGDNIKIAVQCGTDLGERLDNAFQQVFELGYTKVAITGSDIWGLSELDINDALKALDKADCVLGCSEDGGYYLAGFTTESYEPSIFYDIIWSTENVLSETIKKLDKGSKTHHLLRTLPDIDTESDLRYLKEVCFD